MKTYRQDARWSRSAASSNGLYNGLCKNSGSYWLSTAALFGVCVEFDEFAEKRLKGFSQEDWLEHGPI